MKRRISRRRRAKGRFVPFVLAGAVLSVMGAWLWLQQGTRTSANRLIHETSPYLLQHAHNPVDWYPWGEEAFEKARREDKPVFLSVGYSTCYWCHVMEAESFEDLEVAALLNEGFVSIKVDREERPDIDEQYMLATQLMAGRGGWPNSVWLTPHGKPWMAGTYFPKPQFMDLLGRLSELWQDRRSDVDQQAEAVAQAIGQYSSSEQSLPGELTSPSIERAILALTDRYDARHGGFGTAPKFPPHGTVDLLVQRYRETGDDSTLTRITHTLDAMWLGGMHDHIGGGFHRYSTDERWLLPHFEKMLYDNAQLIRSYTDGYLLTGIDRYREAVADIFGWLQREMTSPEGAFYAALDAGEVGREGETYLWRLEEVQEVLGAEDSALFAEIYNLEPEGNFVEQSTGERPGSNIPHLMRSIEAIAEGRGEDAESLARRLAGLRDRLLEQRGARTQPHKDDKILTGWNGLMIGSLAYAGRHLAEPRYIQAAEDAAAFILVHLRRDGTLLRTYRAGQAKLPGYLDDHAYFAQGLVELYRATSEPRWLAEAERLANVLLDEFQDERSGGFFFTTTDHEELILRTKNLGGGGNIPNANGIAVLVLQSLFEETGEQEYRAVAERTLETMAGIMTRQPFGSESLLIAASRHLTGTTNVATVAEGSADPDSLPCPDLIRRVGPVTIRAYASRLSAAPGTVVDVAVAMDIADGWHVYGRNTEADFLIPTTVAVESSEVFSVGVLREPAPHPIEDPVLDLTLNAHTGRIWFRIPVTIRESAGTGPQTLNFQVSTQACDDSRCLLPEEATLRLPIQIDPQAPVQTRHRSLFRTLDPPAEVPPPRLR